MRESHSFQAKWPGRCGICNGEYKTGDWLHYVGRETVAHDYCHGIHWEPPQPKDSDSDRESSYVVRGRRNHEKACSCGLIHAGECL